MIGTITAWVLIGVITIMLFILFISPFILSGMISQQEEEHDGL
jgi:hypothetical protein